MVQWGLRIYGGELQLVDPDGSIIATAELTGDVRAFFDHVQDGDVLNFSHGNV